VNAAGAYSAVRGNPSPSDALVTRHAELVKRIAYHLAGRLPPSVDVADLIQAGMLGLLEAAARASRRMRASASGAP
jgi:RNA polymerase sigma factor for flagellar operon FliA